MFWLTMFVIFYVVPVAFFGLMIAAVPKAFDMSDCRWIIPFIPIINFVLMIAFLYILLVPFAIDNAVALPLLYEKDR